MGYPLKCDIFITPQIKKLYGIYTAKSTRTLAALILIKGYELYRNIGEKAHWIFLGGGGGALDYHLYCSFIVQEKF